MPDEFSAWVTGASGFLGGALSRALAENGYRVTGFGRRSLTLEDQRAIGLSAFRSGDITQPELFDGLGTVPRIVIHCAGAGTVAEVAKAPLANLAATTMGTARLCDWLHRNAPDSRLVAISSAAVYGEATAPQSEEKLALPVSDYGWQKLMAEQLLAAARQNGLTCTSIRFFSLYGDSLRKQVLWDSYHRAHREGQLSLGGTGQEIRDFLHIDDAVRLALLLARCADPPPLVNGGSGQGRSIQEVMTLWMRRVAPTITPCFTGETRPGNPLALIADVGRLQALGFHPQVTLEDGLARMARWLDDEFSARGQPSLYHTPTR